MPADVDADLRHGLDRGGMDPCRHCSSADGRKPVGIKRVDQPLGNLGPGRIMDADE
jgi:hypothetical protein